MDVSRILHRDCFLERIYTRSGARVSSLSHNSCHHGMEIEIRSASASDKKNEDKLSLVQNAV